MKKEEILNLIQSNKEGEYWDFKVSYTNNTVDLLHDIICLSNNLENREAYLIIGIADNGYVKEVKTIPIGEIKKNSYHLLEERICRRKVSTY